MMYRLLTIILLVGLVGALRVPHRQSKTPSSSSHRRLGIYGGTNATIEDYPYLVSIVYDGSLSCTGVIVSESWVITIPDCVAYMEPSLLTVVAESQDGVTGVSYATRNWHTHPKYTGASDYKFTLLEIHGTFSLSDKTQIAKLPSVQPAADTVMQVAGWGETSYGGDGGSLQQGNMTWMAKKTCKEVFDGVESVDTFTSRMGCLYNKSSTTLCSEDYGVPAISEGVVYGQLILLISDYYCTARAHPVLVSDVFPVTAWISEISGAKFHYQ